MNANDIKWIACNHLEHNPFYFSIPEKLDKFGYCIDFSGFGEGMTDKAQMCIIDIARQNEKPNILIICPAGYKESWYNSLLQGVGLDFKFVTSANDAVMYFSAETSNLVLMDEAVLSDNNAPSFSAIKNSGIVWDLLIIDGTGADDGMQTSVYAENIGMKAKKLLIFAPYPAEYTESPDNVKNIVKSVLSESAMADGVDDYPIDESVMKFTMESPLANYPKEESGENKVNIIKYAFDEADIPQNLHIEEQTGRYSHGGNIFEEYNLPERKIYQKPVYTPSDVDALKKKDKKLGKFLELIDGIMNSNDKTAIVYFKSEATVSYIEKILASLYYDKAGSIVYFDKTHFDFRLIKQWYETVPSQRMRVVLATDHLSENCGIYTPITHIINYELPDNPVTLQQRYKRRGLMRGDVPEFTVFLDENGLFDSRILGKVLAGNLYKAFRKNVPSENIMFAIDGIDSMITDAIIDIKYIADYTGAVGSSFDVISHFRQDYNISASRNITTAARAHEYSQRKLEVIANALGVSELIKDKDINKDALSAKISEKVKELRSGFSYFDNDLVVKTVPSKTARTDEFKKFASFLDGNPFNLGLKNAKDTLGEAVKTKQQFVYIKDAISQISDTMKPSVLYNIWIYWHKELGIGGSYAEFIKAYNEGVI